MKSEIPIRKQISLFSMMVALVLFFTGCQGGEGNGTASVRLSFNLSSSKTGAAKTASAPAPSGITSVRIDVTGPGMELLSDSVAVNSEEETVVDLVIPAGPARRFVVTAFDSEEQPHFIGETTVDLEPGTSPTIRIAMIEIGVEVPPIEIAPSSTILTRSEPENPQTETFTLTNATTAEVSLSIVRETSEGTPDLGQITPDENPNNFTYTAPVTIPIDRTQTQIGVPIPITIEAVDNTNPNRRAQVAVKLVTEPILFFPENIPLTSITQSIRPASTDSSGQRSVAFHQGRVYAVWTEFINQERREMVRFSETSDGRVWVSPVPVFPSGSQEESEPTIAMGPDGSIYVAFIECVFCNLPNVRVVVRRPGDATFQPFYVGTIGFSAQNPTLGVSSNGVVSLAWSAQQGSTGFDIVFRRISSEGTPIDPQPINLIDLLDPDSGDANQIQPVLSIGAAGEIFLGWMDEGQLFLTASTNGGDNFISPVPVSDATFSNTNPTLVAGTDGKIYVAWDTSNCDCNDYFVFFNSGRLNGSSLNLNENQPIGTFLANSENQSHPSIALDGAENIYIALVETFFGFDENEILLAKSIDGGLNYSFSQISKRDIRPNKSYPSLAVDGAGRSFAIWERTDFLLEGTINDVFFSMGDDFPFFSNETSLLTRSASISQE